MRTRTRPHRTSHNVTEPRAHLGVLEIAFTDPLDRRRFFASGAFLATIDDQRAVASHITAFGVSGV